MSARRERSIVLATVVLAVALCAGPFGASWAGDSVYRSELLQLGDGIPPAGTAGRADLTPDPDRAGPDWADLFNPDGTLRDDSPYDEHGAPLGNGVPDYRELYGGQWAVFAADDVSAGAAIDGDALVDDTRVANAVVTPDHDLGNAYVYSTFDSAGNLVVFAATERLGSGDTTLEIELNQDHFRLGHGGYGAGVPWRVEGQRIGGDVLVRLTFAGGTLERADASAWDGEGWMPLSFTVGTSCDPSETLCAVVNEQPIERDASSGQVIEAGRFVELGVNIGALLPGDQPAFTTARLRTPQDAAFGYFGEDN